MGIDEITIKVNDNSEIIDAKFKTFGCLAGNSRICTPFGYKRIRTSRFMMLYGLGTELRSLLIALWLSRIRMGCLRLVKVV